METMSESEAKRISEALEIWVGPVPALGYDREAALSERFGAKLAAQLVPVLQNLKHDFYATNAADMADSLQQMHRFAFADFKRKHPEISDQAVNALAAKYTYENR